MDAIRHYIFLVVGLIVAGLVTGWEATAWTAVALIASIFVNSLTSVLGPHILRGIKLFLLYVFTFGSLCLAVAAAVLLFVRYGWIVTAGYAVLLIGYFSVRENEFQRAERITRKVRTEVLEALAQRTNGSITGEQLEARVTHILQHDLPREAFYLQGAVAELLSEKAVSQSQYQLYLRLLAQYLVRVERFTLPSKLHKEVIASLEAHTVS